MILTPNSLYENVVSKEVFRILWIFVEQDEAVLISLDRKFSSPYYVSLSIIEEQINNGIFVELDTYSTIGIITEDNLSDSQLELRNTAWDAIKVLVTNEPNCYDTKKRSLFINEQSKKLTVPRMTIQRYLYKYWANGKLKNSLIPAFKNCGGKGKTKTNGDIKRGRPVLYHSDNKRFNIGEKEYKQIKHVINKYYNKDKKFSLRFVYNKLIEEFYTEQSQQDTNQIKLKDVYPTYGQFDYYAPNFIDHKKRIGSRKYNKDFRGITGDSSKEALGPGSMYQIDATVADIYLVAKFNAKILIGRPVLYFVTDVFSRMITGFYVGLEGPSWAGAMMALYNTITDKVKLCKTFEIDILNEEWPCVGLPQQLMVDNGEMVSKASLNIIEGLGIDILNAPAWRPDLKGIVESKFRLLNIQTKALLPGSVLPDFIERGGKDYRLDAKLNIKEFTEIVIYFILKHNKKLISKHPQKNDDIIKDNVPAIPIEIWNWGIINRTGRLRQAKDNKVKIALMLKDDARVTERGIKFKSILYDCDTAIKEHWYAKARMKGSWACRISYDPRNPKLIYIIYDDGQFEECIPTKAYNDLYENWMLEDIVSYEQSNSSTKASFETRTIEDSVNYTQKVNEIIDKAEESSKVLTLPSISKISIKNIKENRKEEKNLIRQDEHFILESKENIITNSNFEKISFESNHSNMIKRKLAEDLKKSNMKEEDKDE